MLELPEPYLLFLGTAKDRLSAKMAIACATWRPERCVGQIRLPGCTVDAGLSDLSIADAAANGARALVLGVVNPGGKLSPDWTRVIKTALAHGLDIVSGMHERLEGVPEIKQAAEAHSKRLIELRRAEAWTATGNGRKRRGRRLLTVGTDCSVGKMFTALSLERELRRRGVANTFRATGQTGMLIAGSGLAIDAVGADFIAGAAESLSPDGADDHWDLIEGQGSLFHPAFAGVTLGLIHGSQPDAMVLCHEPTRTHMRNVPTQSMPSIAECLDAYERAARVTNQEGAIVGICVNTSALDEGDSRSLLARIEGETGLPTIDPSRGGISRIADQLEQHDR